MDDKIAAILCLTIIAVGCAFLDIPDSKVLISSIISGIAGLAVGKNIR